MGHSNVQVTSFCWVPSGGLSSEFQSPLSFLHAGQCCLSLCFPHQTALLNGGWVQLGAESLALSETPPTSFWSPCPQSPLTRWRWSPLGPTFHQALGERRKEQKNSWTPFLQTPLQSRMAKDSETERCRAGILHNATVTEHGSQGQAMPTQPLSSVRSLHSGDRPRK